MHRSVLRAGVAVPDAATRREAATVSTVEPDSLAGDLLTGAADIARELDKTERQTQWLLEQGLLPAFKIGRIWHARRSTIRRYFADLERRAMAGADSPEAA